MPRMFTQKEMKYMFALSDRNTGLIRNENSLDEEKRKIWHQGLERPMSNRERKLRERIRKKTERAAIDLCLAFYAGVLPRGKKIEDPGGIINDIYRDLIFAMVIKE